MFFIRYGKLTYVLCLCCTQTHCPPVVFFTRRQNRCNRRCMFFQIRVHSKQLCNFRLAPSSAAKNSAGLRSLCTLVTAVVSGDPQVSGSQHSRCAKKLCKRLRSGPALDGVDLEPTATMKNYEGVFVHNIYQCKFSLMF